MAMFVPRACATMSSPRAFIQILVVGGRIFGKAIFEASRQAVKNAKYRPVLAEGEAAGLRNATSSSPTDALTREHRMAIDEARSILNIQRGEPAEKITESFDYLFKANSPPAKSESPTKPQKGMASGYSHYLQSKIVRAKERLEAEMKIAKETSEPVDSTVPPASDASTPPPPGTPPL